MSSVITLSIRTEHGELLSKQALTIDYGNDHQEVTVFLDDPDLAGLPTLTFREVLDESMAEQLAMTENFDA